MGGLWFHRGSIRGTEKDALEIGSTVLASGKSLQLRHEKTLETVGTKSLLQWAVLSVNFFNSAIIPVTAAKQFLLRFFDYPKIEDGS